MPVGWLSSGCRVAVELVRQIEKSDSVDCVCLFGALERGIVPWCLLFLHVLTQLVACWDALRSSMPYDHLNLRSANGFNTLSKEDILPIYSNVPCRLLYCGTRAFRSMTIRSTTRGIHMAQMRWICWRLWDIKGQENGWSCKAHRSWATRAPWTCRRWLLYLVAHLDSSIQPLILGTDSDIVRYTTNPCRDSVMLRFKPIASAYPDGFSRGLFPWMYISQGHILLSLFNIEKKSTLSLQKSFHSLNR